MQDHTREELYKHLITGDVEGVNKLLASGDIESPDQMLDMNNDGDEGTLLMWACGAYSKHNDISLIRALVKNHNANVDAQQARGFSSVHFAVGFGLDCVLRFFVEEGRANLELRDRDGATALHLACGHCNSTEEMVPCLLDNHADVNAVSEDGFTPLHYAALGGKFSIALLLLADDRVNIEAITERGSTPLHLACWKGHAEIVELLLSKGANPDAVEHEWGRTPLVYAAHFGNTNCADALIKTNADVNKGCCNGHTALHYAVEKGNVDVVELLLKAKADWSAKDNRNRMPVEMVKAEHRGPVETLFVDTLIGMVQKHQAFRDTFLRGIKQEICLLKTLKPDVVPHIAGYCDAPMGDELEKIRVELDRLRPGCRGQKRKRQT